MLQEIIPSFIYSNSGKLLSGGFGGSTKFRKQPNIMFYIWYLNQLTNFAHAVRAVYIIIESGQLKTWAPFSVHFSLPPIGARVNLLVLCGYLLDVRIMSNTQTQLDIMTWFSWTYNYYWIDMLVVPVVQFAAKSTQKTAMYFASEMDRKWRPSNKNRNVIGQTRAVYKYTRLWARLYLYTALHAVIWLRHLAD